MMYNKPTNVEEIANVIAELELKATSQKMDIEESFIMFSDSLKPMNLLKDAWHSVFSRKHSGKPVNLKGVIGKMAGKFLHGHKKNLPQPVDAKMPLLISNG